jgi:hypothetical protein
MSCTYCGARAEEKLEGGDDKNEIVLSAFAGTCYLCKSKYHTATDCPKKNTNCGDGGRVGGRGDDGGRGNQGRGKLMQTRNQCGKLGHMKGGGLKQINTLTGITLRENKLTYN